MTSARILADSISPDGVRLTTMEVVMHRFVLAEFNTHRVFSRNSASSRAIPLMKQIKNIREGIAYPVSWPSEQPGMQGGDEIDDVSTAQAVWDDVADYAINAALRLGNLRLHKSVVNRLLEPFMYHRVLVTSTEWENFFALRCHPMAQPEIRVAAEMMEEAYNFSQPRIIGYGDWHIPFVDMDDLSETTLESRLKTSAACCAWVSTANHDGEHSWEAVNRMYDRLSQADPMHASPFEHQATPHHDPVGNFRGWAQLRHFIEAGNVPWKTHWQPMLREDAVDEQFVVVNNISIGGHVDLEADFDAPSEGLLDGIEPLRPEREGREGDTQPLPEEGVGEYIVDLVKTDLDARLQLGIARYGKGLQAFNGRNPKQDLYEELMDALCYLKQDMEEDRIREQAALEVIHEFKSGRPGFSL